MRILKKPKESSDEVQLIIPRSAHQHIAFRQQLHSSHGAAFVVDEATSPIRVPFLHHSIRSGLEDTRMDSAPCQLVWQEAKFDS